MTELLSGVETPSDAELISRVRGGDVAAYGELFSRHVDAARRLGRQLVRGPDVDDLVSEAFAKTLNVLQAGGGPDVAFRAYVLTSVRRLHVDKLRAAKKVQPSDDMTVYDDGLPFQDTVVASFESGAAARAFSSLPERWQLVLWHLEVEGQKPADIAPLLGMSANSVSALAYRAREGLRQAFLTMHLADCPTEQCRWVNEHLGAYVRKGLSRRDTAKVEEHIEGCRRCAAMYLELNEVNSNLAGIIAPLLLGAAAAGYISSGGAGLTGISALVGRIRDAVGANAGGGAAATTGGAAATGSAVSAGGVLVAGGVIAAGVAAVTTAAFVFGSPNESVTGADRPVDLVQTPPADPATDGEPGVSDPADKSAGEHDRPTDTATIAPDAPQPGAAAAAPPAPAAEPGPGPAEGHGNAAPDAPGDKQGGTPAEGPAGDGDGGPGPGDPGPGPAEPPVLPPLDTPQLPPADPPQLPPLEVPLPPAEQPQLPPLDADPVPPADSPADPDPVDPAPVDPGPADAGGDEGPGQSDGNPGGGNDNNPPTGGGNTEPGDTQPGDTQPGDTQPGDTPPGDTPPGDTQPPARIQTAVTVGNAAIVEGLLQFDIEGDPVLPDEVTVTLTSDPDGITFAAGGNCETTGTKAVCRPVPDFLGAGLAVQRAATDGTARYRAMIPLAIPEGQPDTALSFAVTAPEKYDVAGDTTGEAAYEAPSGSGDAGEPADDGDESDEERGFAFVGSPLVEQVGSADQHRYTVVVTLEGVEEGDEIVLSLVGEQTSFCSDDDCGQSQDNTRTVVATLTDGVFVYEFDVRLPGGSPASLNATLEGQPAASRDLSSPRTPGKPD